MKILKRIMAGLASGIVIVGSINVQAQSNINTLPLINPDIMEDSVNDVSDVIINITDNIDIQPEKTESSYVYAQEPESHTQVYYSEPVYEDQPLTLTYDEFMSMYGDQLTAEEPEEPETVLIPADTSEAQSLYEQALASYNMALAEYEAASQMIETTREVEVEIIEEVTDEEGNVTEVIRTEIQTVTEMVPAGDVASAQLKLDAASAALNSASQALEAAQAQTTIVEQPKMEDTTPIPTPIVEPEPEQEVIIKDDVVVKEEVTQATSGTCGVNLTWTLDDEGLLTISGTGKMNNYEMYNNIAPWGRNIKKVVIEYGVTNIGSYAFYGCTSLKDILIPRSVTTIENSAFSGCRIITSITIPTGVTSIGEAAFSSCALLTTITLPPRITSIGDHLFNNSGLTEITIPNSVTSIGLCAFCKCSWLTSITIPNSVTRIDGRAFSGCSDLTNITIPNSVTSLRNYTFEDCSKLTSITIPNSVTTIGNGVFKNCSTLSNIIISDSVANIGKDAFIGCSSLTLYVYPDSEGLSYAENEQIPYEIYYPVDSLVIEDMEILAGTSKAIIYTITPDNCSDPTVVWTSSDDEIASIDENGIITAKAPGSVIITGKINHRPLTVTSTIQVLKSKQIVQEGTCGENLTWTLDDEGLLTIDGTGSMFDYSISNEEILVDKKKNPVGWGEEIKKVVIENGVTSIGDCAFFNCTSLTEITIPESITTIGASSFFRCYYLANFTIPNNVTKIGTYAFYGCNGITEIVIPNGITTIEAETFRSCEGLITVTIPNSVTSIGYRAFYWCGRLSNIIIPDSVTYIGNEAFAYCNLTSITIPNSVTFIGGYAFDGCDELSDVYYRGTQAEWEEKNLYTFDDSVTIHFIDDIPFTDVPKDAWYYSTAKECYETGLINGTSATTFSPMQTMTRAMVVTILWRMDGQPKTAFNNKFKDVTSKQWYGTSISWAVNNGVVNGYGDGTFKPDAAVTREQVAVMLANYATYKKVYKPGTKKLNTYPDGSQVSTWAQQGMKWALTNGIISGDGAGYLHPKKSATRAEGAAMLLRMNNWL